MICRDFPQNPMKLLRGRMQHFLRGGMAIPPGIRLGAAGWNKTGTFDQGMLYVDNQGIAELAGSANV
jgi:hypothetical protein